MNAFCLFKGTQTLQNEKSETVKPSVQIGVAQVSDGRLIKVADEVHPVIDSADEKSPPRKVAWQEDATKPAQLCSVGVTTNEGEEKAENVKDIPVKTTREVNIDEEIAKRKSEIEKEKRRKEKQIKDQEKARKLRLEKSVDNLKPKFSASGRYSAAMATPPVFDLVSNGL